MPVKENVSLSQPERFKTSSTLSRVHCCYSWHNLCFSIFALLHCSPALIVLCSCFLLHLMIASWNCCPLPQNRCRSASCVTLLPLVSYCASLYPVSEKTSNSSRLCDFLIIQPPFIFTTAWLGAAGATRHTLTEISALLQSLLTIPDECWGCDLCRGVKAEGCGDWYGVASLFTAITVW